jgi:hypothetical protein
VVYFYFVGYEKQVLLQKKENDDCLNNEPIGYWWDNLIWNASGK